MNLQQTVVFVYSEEDDWTILFIAGVNRISTHTISAFRALDCVIGSLDYNILRTPVKLFRLERGQDWFDKYGEYVYDLPDDCWEEIRQMENN